MLADRIAAALVHREPGWRLPRGSVLARRYNVSPAAVDAALADLARRSVVRRLPDGQFYRASPADYWIPVEGTAGLGTRLDPMGAAIACRARHESWREAPQEVAGALGLPAGAPVRVVRCVWAVGGAPAAVSTAYLTGSAPGGEPPGGPGPHGPPGSAAPGAALTAMPAGAVSVEMGPPQPSVARSLRLPPGHPAIAVTARFDDPVTGEPAGLAVVVLKPGLFRIAVEMVEPGPARRAGMDVGEGD